MAPTCELDVAIRVEREQGAAGEPPRQLALRAVAFGQRLAPVALAERRGADGGGALRLGAQLGASLRLGGAPDAAAEWVATSEPLRAELVDMSTSPPALLAYCTLAQPRVDAREAAWASADGAFAAAPTAATEAAWARWHCRLELRLRVVSAQVVPHGRAADVAVAPRGRPSAPEAAAPPRAIGAAASSSPPSSSSLHFYLLLRFSTMRLRFPLAAVAANGGLQLEASFASCEPFASALISASQILAATRQADADGDGRALPLATEFVGGALARLDFDPREYSPAAVLRLCKTQPLVVRLLLRAAGGSSADEPTEGVELAAGAVSLEALATARLELSRAGERGALLAASAILPCEGALELERGGGGGGGGVGVGGGGGGRWFARLAPSGGGGGSSGGSSGSDSWQAEGYAPEVVGLVALHAQLCAQPMQPEPGVPTAAPAPPARPPPPPAAPRSPPRASPPRPRRRVLASDYEWACERAAGGGSAHVRAGSAASASEWQYRLAASLTRLSDGGLAARGGLNLYARAYSNLAIAHAGAEPGGGRGARSISTRPAVELRAGGSVSLPNNAATFTLVGRPADVVELLAAAPLLLELWHRDRYASDEAVGYGACDWLELLTLAPTPVPLAAAAGRGTRGALAHGDAAAAAPVWRRQLRAHVPILPTAAGASGQAQPPGQPQPVAYLLVELELFESPMPPAARTARTSSADVAAPAARPRAASAGRARGAAEPTRAAPAAESAELVPRRLLDALQRQVALRERARDGAQAGQQRALLALEARLRAQAAAARRRDAALRAREAAVGSAHGAKLEAARAALAAGALDARAQQRSVEAEQQRTAARQADLSFEAERLRTQLQGATAALHAAREEAAAHAAAAQLHSARLRDATAERERERAAREAAAAAAASAQAEGHARLRAALGEAEAVRVAHERQIARLLQHSAKQSASQGLDALARAHGAEQAAEAAELGALREQLEAETRRVADARDAAEDAPPRALAQLGDAAAPRGAADDDADAPHAAAERLRARRDELLSSGLYAASDGLIVKMQQQLRTLVERAAALHY